MQTNWTETDVIVDGVRLHIYRMGIPGGPPLVLVHGFSDNGLCWLPVAQELASRYDIVMPDARGHGLSARLDPAARGDMTADLVGIVRALELERPIVAGHSMGAMTAFHLGVRYPGLPRALILEDPVWRLPDPSAAAESPAEKGTPLRRGNPLEQWLRSMDGLSLEELIAQTRDQHPTWSDTVVHWWSEGKRQLDLNVFEFGGMAWSDWQEGVRALACPTLVVTAAPDKGGIVTPEVARWAVEVNEHISVAHIPGTGHHVRFEDHEAYMGVVKAFLAGLE
ncbi:MAG: alpha/beta hydrolase [Anaerolineae bacterium]|nr:alpha/beta hydrolase [Anaerolineae bacterium]